MAFWLTAIACAVSLLLWLATASLEYGAWHHLAKEPLSPAPIASVGVFSAAICLGWGLTMMVSAHAFWFQPIRRVLAQQLAMLAWTLILAAACFYFDSQLGRIGGYAVLVSLLEVGLGCWMVACLSRSPSSRDGEILPDLPARALASLAQWKMCILLLHPQVALRISPN